MDIYVQPDKLKEFAKSCGEMKSSVANIESSFISLTSSLSWRVKSRAGIERIIKNLRTRLDNAEDTLYNHKEFFNDSAEDYEEAEKYEQRESQELKNNLYQGKSSGSIKVIPKTDVITFGDSDDSDGFHSFIWDLLFGKELISGTFYETIKNWAGELWGVDSSGEASFKFLDGKVETENGMNFKFKNEDGSWNFKEFGIKEAIKATGAIASGKVSGSFGYLSGDAGIDVITGTVKGEAKATLFEDGEFKPSLSLGASAEGSVVSGEANASLGTDNFGVQGSAKGSLLYGKAEGTLGIGELGTDSNGNTTYGFAAEGSAMAAAAQGKVSGGVTIFGIEINASTKGYLGAVGVEGGASVTTSGVTASFGGALGLGGGLEISVDWSGLGNYIQNAYDTASNFISSLFNW